MEKQGGLSGGWRFLRNVVLIDVAIFLIVGLVCWTGGWYTIYQYGGGLFWAGMLAIIIGASSVRGVWGTSRRFETQYGLTVSEQSIHQRMRQQMADVAESNRFCVLMFAAALVSMVIGAVIQTVFR
jgi:hypothetical protein